MIPNDLVVKNAKIGKFFKDFFVTLRQTECLEIGRKRPQDFSRNREMTFSKLITFLIFRNGKNSNQDLAHFYSSIHQSECMISKQALFKALHKVNPGVFDYLMNHFTQLFYQSDLVKTYREYLILVEDGSSVDAPFSDHSLDTFGFQINQYVREKSDVKTVVAKAGGLFDMTNGFFLSMTIRGRNDSEIPMAYHNLTNVRDCLMGRKAIYLADRYYGGVELFQYLEMNNLKFCIRGKTNFYKEEVLEIKHDGWITLKMTKTWLKRIKNDEVRAYMETKKNIQLRVVKHRLVSPNKNDEDYHLYFTNLSEDEFSTQEISNLYKFRWDIETQYKFFKVDLEAERFNTSHVDIYLSKLLAKVILLNCIGIIKAEVNHQRAHKKTQKHHEGFKTKFNCLKDLVYQSQIIFAIMSENLKLLKGELKTIMLSAFKNIVPIRNNRHYKRYGRFMKSTSNYRFSTDGRNKPNVRKTKYGLRTIQP